MHEEVRLCAEVAVVVGVDPGVVRERRRCRLPERGAAYRGQHTINRNATLIKQIQNKASNQSCQADKHNNENKLVDTFALILSLPSPPIMILNSLK